MMISVVVPCRNEKDNITECLEAIYNSGIGNASLEVIVVDGMSDDGTIDLLNTLKSRFPNLSVIANPARVTPVAFNLGIKAAKGEYIQIVGARQIISKDYLAGAVDSLQKDDSIWCVGGAVTNVYQNEMSEVIGLAMSSRFGVGAGNFRILKKSTFTDTVGTPMYPRAVFDEVGYFNERLIRNQDDEFNFRITSKGKKILLNADINIKYYVRAKLKNLYRQYYQYGYWKVYVNTLHASVTNLRQLVPLIFVLGLLTGPLTFLIHPVFIWIYLGCIATYLVTAVVLGFSLASQPRKAFRIASVFPVLHISYGLGYLKGLIDFVLLRRQPAESATTLSRS